MRALRTLDVNTTLVDDQCIRLLPEDIENLYLDYTEITALGLRQIGRFSKLQRLGLAGTPIDSGLHFLRRCPQLRYLNVSESDLTDGGLAALGRCPNLEELIAFRTGIRGHGLAKLQNIAGLNLFQTNLDKRGVDEIAMLSKLTYLFLHENKLVDADLANIGKMERLEYLNLANNNLSDAILPELAKLVRLKNGLDLSKNPNITPAGVESLRRKLRRCPVYF